MKNTHEHPGVYYCTCAVHNSWTPCPNAHGVPVFLENRDEPTIFFGQRRCPYIYRYVLS